MKKELADSLRHMQSHPTTGIPHNQQVVSAQVETIFAIDELKEQIEGLNKTLESNEQQNLKLELSNIKLQTVMLILTSITTAIASFPVLLFIINLVSPVVTGILKIGAIPFMLTALMAGLLSGAIAGTTFKYEKKFTDRIKLKESLDIVLRDKDGNIKETRHIED